MIYAAFSPDGRWLASGDDDKNIRIWDVSTGQEIAGSAVTRSPIYAVAFSPNGRWLASASADKTIKLWDVATGREIHTLTGHGSIVTSLAFSPDGRWLASGSWDKTIKIWDVRDGHECRLWGSRPLHLFGGFRFQRTVVSVGERRRHDQSLAIERIRESDQTARDEGRSLRCQYEYLQGDPLCGTGESLIVLFERSSQCMSQYVCGSSAISEDRMGVLR